MLLVRSACLMLPIMVERRKRYQHARIVLFFVYATLLATTNICVRGRVRACLRECARVRVRVCARVCGCVCAQLQLDKRD